MEIASTILVLAILLGLLYWSLRRQDEAEIEIIQMPKEPDVEPCKAHGCARNLTKGG